MPPTSDGNESKIRTVGCELSKFMPDHGHLATIRDAVQRVHTATLLATELLNIHLRVMLQERKDLQAFFDKNALRKAFNVVTFDPNEKAVPDPDLVKTRDAYMPAFEKPNRNGVGQCINDACKSLATVAATNVWFHFSKRILAHVRRTFALDKEAYAALSKDEKRTKRLSMFQVASDLCRIPNEDLQAPVEYHKWIESERLRLGIDAAVGNWDQKPLIWHLKAKPHRFIQIMAIMSQESEAAGGKSYALYPLRRSHVPKHVRFDEKAFRDLFKLRGEYVAHMRKMRKLESERKEENCTGETEVEAIEPTNGKKRKKRSKDETKNEKLEFFNRFVDLRQVKQREFFDNQFTTDGVTVRVQMLRKMKKQKNTELRSMPSRGIWAIDELKRITRLESIHTVGVDPGKRELIVAVDMDNPKTTPVRYTQAQRKRDQCKAQYNKEELESKSQAVDDAEASLVGFNSKSADLKGFCDYCAARHAVLRVLSDHYSGIDHRQRRWKKYIKTQQSEARLVKQLKEVQKDNRPLVLAYGSWGMIAGRPGMACNKGNDACIGVGLMRKLAKHFVVSPTPEAYTSKTCCKCLGPCGPWSEIEAKMGRKIRGLRRCQNEECTAKGGIPLNRDRCGATNIGTNFNRLLEGKNPIRSMTDEDLAFHRATACFECE